MPSLRERYEAKVARDATTGCWIWTAGTSSGYGQIGVGEGRREYAHRIAWELHRGPVPDGLCVLHNCPTGDNRLCVNPEHLFLGTKGENARDRSAKGRSAVGVRVHTAKLTDQDALAILDSNESLRVLATRFGVSKRAITFVKRRTTWKHVQPDAVTT